MSVVATPYRVNPTSALLGEIVSWHTAKETEVSRVRTALSEAGLDPDEAKDLRTRSAFSRAANHLKENRSIDKVHESKDGKVTFQLDRKQIVTVSEDRKQLHHNYECQVTLDTKTGDISCPENSVIEQKARELFAHAMNVRTASDITRLVQRLFKENADLFPINPSKGVAYFVPDPHRDFTERVEQFMERVGGTISRFPVPKGTEAGNKSVRDAVQEGLSAVISELDTMVSEWDDTTRKSTQDKTIEKYKLLRHKAQVYATYLQHTATDIHAKLDASKAKLNEKLAELASAEPSTT